MAKNPWIENTGEEPLLGWALVEVKLKNGQKLQGQIRQFDWRLCASRQHQWTVIVKWRRYDA